MLLDITWKGVVLVFQEKSVAGAILQYLNEFYSTFQREELLLLTPPRKLCDSRRWSVCLICGKITQKIINRFPEILRKCWYWAEE